MNPRMKSRQVILTYSLFQLPSAVIVIGVALLVKMWIGFPWWLVWLIGAVWITKDIVLYPFVWCSYDPQQRKEANSLIGQEGVARDRLAPSGYIRIRNELWKAEVKERGVVVEAGEPVKVNGVRGITLYVSPISDAQGTTRNLIVRDMILRGGTEYCRPGQFHVGHVVLNFISI